MVNSGDYRNDGRVSYNWNTGQYENSNGDAVGFGAALSSVGVSIDTNRNRGLSGISMLNGALAQYGLSASAHTKKKEKWVLSFGDTEQEFGENFFSKDFPNDANLMNKELSLCQDGGCFDPIDFNRDNAKTIYKKLVKNIGNLIRLRNEAITNGTAREAVYITDFVSKTSDLVGFDIQVKTREINYDGGSIEIVANLGKGERVTTAHSLRPTKGIGKVWQFEFQILGEGRNKLKNHSGTFFKPALLRLIFKNNAQYNRFINNINKESR